MATDHAGIYLVKDAENAFKALPKRDRRLLADFLNDQLDELDRTGGGEKEGCAAEWKPGWGVFWDVKLRPRYLRSGTSSARPTLGSAYRIEVLEICSLS
jgi:hypothetical protein